MKQLDLNSSISNITVIHTFSLYFSFMYFYLKLHTVEKNRFSMEILYLIVAFFNETV